MRFWFSGEVDAEIAEAFRVTRTSVERRLNDALADRAYGTGVTEIALIPIVLGQQFADRPERRLLQRAQGTADYRLHISFEAFRSGDERCREQFLVRNTIQVIDDISRKANRAKIDFAGDLLKRDVLSVFSLSPDDLARYDEKAA
jgi:immunity protein 44 of polymorphic toxin system